ncbi:MAG: enoyl-CoA hydratase/carnithine racemase [Candidatus Azotimanducaceae bacterium]|jgi:enoyl-CoA hydratase/carnithine racemase|tara:strand:+ start:12787 stop:13542 length:756 start_codon:yes stop_codon:yes gene_type:complete
MLTSIKNSGGVRTLTFNRPEALNAFNDAMFDAVAADLLAASADDSVKVLVITGAGRAFSAGMDLAAPRKGQPAKYGFPGMFEAIVEFPKPIILAINGLGVGFGCTICGLADLVFMASNARLRCPFTSLGLTAEASSTVTFPQLMGYQNAFWSLLSSQWMDAQTCKKLGLVFALTEPEQLLAEVYEYAQILAAQPLASLIATKELLMAPRREGLRAAHKIENVALANLLGGPANLQAVAAFKERRPADFSNF